LSGGGTTTKAGFGIVVGREDFTADPAVHISIKPEESDINDCYIVRSGLFRLERFKA